MSKRLDKPFYPCYTTPMTALINLNDATALNKGILDTIRGMNQSILTLGLALVAVKQGKLYRELGFQKWRAYLLYLSKESKRSRSSIYHWLQIGEIYEKHKAKLETIGFTSHDGPTKLPHLERALAENPEDEVLANLKTMTHREFAQYARSERVISAVPAADIPVLVVEAPDEDLDDTQIECETLTSWGHSFYYRGKEAARVNKNLPWRILRMLLPAIRLSFNALDKRSYVLAVHLNNYREYTRFKEIAIKAREDMRAGII